MAIGSYAGQDTRPGTSVVTLSSGTADPNGYGRAIFIFCTTSGQIVLKFADGTSLTLAAFPTGVYEFNWSITQYTGSGGFVGVVANIY